MLNEMVNDKTKLRLKSLFPTIKTRQFSKVHTAGNTFGYNQLRPNDNPSKIMKGIKIMKIRIDLSNNFIA